MPIDPVASQSATMRVRDRVGLNLPFSRGIMASAILATGLPTDRAYAIASAFQRLVDEGAPNSVLEGVHLLPGLVTRGLSNHDAHPVVVERLLTLDDEGVHRAQLRQRTDQEPGRGGNRSLDHIAAIRHIQDHLAGHAARNGVGTYELEDPTELTQQVVDAVVAMLEERSGMPSVPARA